MSNYPGEISAGSRDEYRLQVISSIPNRLSEANAQMESLPRMNFSATRMILETKGPIYYLRPNSGMRTLMRLIQSSVKSVAAAFIITVMRMYADSIKTLAEVMPRK